MDAEAASIVDYWIMIMPSIKAVFFDRRELGRRKNWADMDPQSVYQKPIARDFGKRIQKRRFPEMGVPLNHLFYIMGFSIIKGSWEAIFQVNYG